MIFVFQPSNYPAIPLIDFAIAIAIEFRQSPQHNTINTPASVLG
jgi:hypothetical protein